MTKTLLAWALLLGLMTPTIAAVVEVELTAPLSAAEFAEQGEGDQQLQLWVAAPSFTVASGDTLRVTWKFADAEAFQLLPDPHIGLQAWLPRADPGGPTYVFGFAPSWTFLDWSGSPTLFGSEARQYRSGTELHSGGLTVASTENLEVAGVRLELADLTYLPTDPALGIDRPLAFNGARFLIHNAAFASPFVGTPPGGQVSTPATWALSLAALVALLALRRPLRAMDGMIRR